MKHAFVSWVPAAAVIVSLAGFSALAHAEDSTAPALRLANQRERAAQQRYVLDAAAARAECCPQAAALFDALAAAEAVHANRTALALDRLGVAPAPALATPAVGTTLENLRAALAAEDFERRAAYPRFMDCARAECDYDALAVLRDNRAAETTHANRVALLLARLTAPPLTAGEALAAGDNGVTYFVCEACGRVRSHESNGHCACGASARQIARFAAPADPTLPPALIAVR